MKICLRQVKEGGRPLTAKENISALAENPNGWMTRHDTKLCRDFDGSEYDASELLNELEETCTLARNHWEYSQ